MNHDALVFNPPPGWPVPPPGWKPPAGWTPDAAWPAPPPGWQLWVGNEDAPEADEPADATVPDAPPQTAEVADREGDDLAGRVMVLEAENAALRQRLTNADSHTDELVVLDDDRVLQEVGIYRYHHPLESAAAFKDRLDALGAGSLSSSSSMARSRSRTCSRSTARWPRADA